MTILNDNKNKLITVKENLDAELVKANALIGNTFLNPKLDAKAPSLKANNLKIQLDQVDRELESIDQAIADAEVQALAKAKTKLMDDRKTHIRKACIAINKAWGLQEQLVDVLNDASFHDAEAVSRGDDIEIQVRLMAGQMLGNCKIHHVTAAGVMGINRVDMDDTEISRIQSNLI